MDDSYPPATVAQTTSEVAAPSGRRRVYPFTALVGQEVMRDALLLAVIDPGLGGVLVTGDRGTGKSTMIRALAALLPDMDVVEGCAYSCEPRAPVEDCPSCGGRSVAAGAVAARRPVPVVDLPLGATEDRIVGALDLERALVHGEKAFEPGLLARAHRGFLYIDEINLLEDHLVDVLLDAAASGENLIERDGLSVRHPARFVLVGSGNPEEGELRPQLLDRFGLACDVRTPIDIATRVEVVRRRDAFERDPQGFLARFAGEEEALRARLAAARARLPRLEAGDEILEGAARLCVALGTDGLRGELTLVRAARAAAALEGSDTIGIEHLRAWAAPALRHRLRRSPLDEGGSDVRIERAMAEVFGS
jgi:magnesium chelatase subunit I